jgi:type IX secretion system PorP/SprF family membrane protein
MMKNRTVLLALCLVGLMSVKAHAQQRPHYTQYILNQYIINPALSGIENYTDLKISHRHQWVGFEGAPVTTYLTVHTPLGKKDYRTTATTIASMEGENPRGSSYWENYTAAQPHHGIGFQLINDRTGPISYQSGYVTYAYHIGISPRTTLSGGVGVGASRISLDPTKLDISRGFSIDPAVFGSGELNRIKPDLTAGLYLYSADYFIGVSAQQILQQGLDFSNNQVKTNQGKTIPHLFGTAGYRFLLNADFNLLPSVMVKYVQPTGVQFDVNAKLQYRDFLWLGGTYRQDFGFAGMAGLNISNRVNVGYAYDMSTNNIGTYQRGTHELLIGFILNNGYGDTCPRNVW